jgi:pimeloyl-ACP methyl ester carboxylesterase
LAELINLGKMQQIARIQKFVPKRNIWYKLSKPDEKASIPWRFVQIQATQSQPRIQVAVYNQWTSLTPPNPLLMIHGLAGSHKSFAPLVRHTNYPWGLIAHDMRGHGGSEKVPTGQIDLHHHVLDYFRLIQQFQRPFFNVIAYDTGAALALRVAQTNPELIGCIVLVQSGRLGPNFSKDLKAGYQKELTKKLKTFKSREEILNAFSEGTPSVDVKDRLNYEYKDVQGRLLPRAQNDVVLKLVEENEVKMPTEVTMKMVQHPIVVIRSEFGFEKGSPNVIVTDKDVAEFKHHCNVKEVHTLKGAVHGTILETHSAEIMTIVDNFMEKYDIQKYSDGLINTIRQKEEIQASFVSMYGKDGVLEYFTSK